MDPVEPHSSTPDVAPPHWRLEPDSQGNLQLHFELKQWGTGIVLGGGGIALFGYGIGICLKNWFIDGAPILPAGVVLCLVFVLGLCFAVYMLDRLLLTSVVYTLGSEFLQARVKSLFRRSHREIRRNAVQEILINYIPPKGSHTSGMTGSYTTLLVYSPTGVRTDSANYAMEGWTQEEAHWLSGVLAGWAGVPVRQIQDGG